MSAARDAGAYLHHIQLLTPEPDRLADFYARALQMDRAGATGTVSCDGEGRLVLFGQGAPKRLGFAAFAVRDAESLAAIRASAERNGVPIEAFPSPFLAEAVAVRDPDGNVIAFGLATPHGCLNDPARLVGRLQHLTFATRDLAAFEAFYAGKLGFFVSDRVRDAGGRVTTCFTTSNHEHHTIAAFLSPEAGIDHHSYEAGEWGLIRDWCDHLASQKIALIWGPGRHGPGNNLFVFIEDPDGNWIEISAELEVLDNRPTKEWPHEPRTLNLWGNAMMRV